MQILQLGKTFFSSMMKKIYLLFIVMFMAGCSYDALTNVQEGEQVNSDKQEVLFYTDDQSSDEWLDVVNRTVLVNGVNKTSDTTFVSTSEYLYVVYTPTDIDPLPQGEVNVYLTIPPKDERWWKFWESEFETEINIVVDSIAPEITAISPEDGELIADPNMPLTYQIIDTGLGLDLNGTRIIVNGEDKTALSIFENGVLTYTPTSESPLPITSFDVNVTAKDILGNTASAIFNYVVQSQIELTAYPRAVPETATAPATIRFSPVVTTDTAIQTYQWDLDGDGVYEESDIVGNTHSRYYTTPGDYNVSLRVTDAKGEVLVGSTIVKIQNLPPYVQAEATPSNGEIPLEVSFVVSAVDNEGIAKYEWDFEGDGIYDYESLTSGNTQHTYTEVGQYSPRIRVTDMTGASAIYDLPTTTVNAAVAGSPSVTATANVQSGTAPLVVNLGAVATDPQGMTFTLWEWDYDGDGTYDYSSDQSAAVSYTFTRGGTQYPRVRVTTEDGRTTTDAIEIKVANTVSISRDLNTIDVALGQSASITTSFSGDTKMSLVIESRNNQVARTLVDWTERPAGSYTDTWDGYNNDGGKLPEGDYYAVLLYEEDGTVKRVDLRDTTGGAQFNPTRNNAARTFSPFDNNPMNITFTLNEAAEVTAFMGYSYSNTRVVTFFSRQPMPKGSHTVKWYSTNNEGVIIKAPPGKYFMYGNWAYKLANNAIYVKSGAHITNVSATPAIFDPTGHKEDGFRATSNVHFNLTSDADVELTVTDAESGLLVAYRKYENLLAGENTIEWDGRNGSGDFIAPGKFRLGVRAVDETGYSSLIQYTLQRIYY